MKKLKSKKNINLLKNFAKIYGFDYKKYQNRWWSEIREKIKVTGEDMTDVDAKEVTKNTFEEKIKIK